MDKFSDNQVELGVGWAHPSPSSFAGLPTLSFCIAFTGFEEIEVRQSCFRGSACIELLYCILDTLRRCHCNQVGSTGVPARIKLLYCVLHGLRRYQCNKVGSVGVPGLSFCIVFYTL